MESLSELHEAAASGELVVLFGSGVSMWTPTKLPTGVELSSAIWRATLRASALDSAGEYYAFQQLALWSRRFGLKHDVTRSPELYSALPIDEGYRQLAYAMAQMMAFRDDILLEHAPWTAQVENQAVAHAKTAAALGLEAEAWKLNYLLLRRAASRRRRFLRPALFHFMACQYNFIMRAWQLIAMN